MADGAKAPRRLLYVVAEDWFFASHFLPMARTAIALGFEVAVATRVTRHREAIAAEGIRVIPTDAERGAINPIAAVRQIAELAQIMKRERPALVHCIALRSVVLGGMAARRAKVPAALLAVTGLGHLWVSRSAASALGRAAVTRAARRLRRPGTAFLFENHDDPAALGLDPGAADVAYVPGSGVDPAAFPPSTPPPTPPFRAAIAARMLWAKGIDTAVEAIGKLRQTGLDVTLDLWGKPDPGNPASIPEHQLAVWSRQPGIVWHGSTADVAGIWRNAHVALLPSRYREGLPRSLIEAMAAGRPVVTTDVPGCREIVRDGVEGLIVPPRDADALAEAIGTLAADAALRERMGKAALARFRDGYTSEIVAGRIAELYRRLA